MSLWLPPLVARAAAFRDRPAIIDRGISYDYDQLDRTSSAVAARLLATARDADLREERVAFMVAPGFAHVTIQWGIWRAGGIAVPLPLSYPPIEVDFLIRDSGASIVVSDATHARMIAPIAEATGAQLIVTDSLMDRTGATAGSVNHAEPTPSSRRAMIIYTSGTTSRPKGVVSTHGQISAQIASLVEAWAWTAADRTLLVLPLHHIHGIINVVGSALWSGATLEMHPTFDTEATWERLGSGELTVFTAVPTIYHRLIRSWEASADEVRRARSHGCRSLRLMMSGSAALPRAILDRWRGITGHVLLERYGMTEVGMALSNPLNGERRPGFVGLPLPGVTARLVDGELQLKGPGVFAEYWNRPDATREAFDAGWFRTGDVAVFEDGSYRLLGRSSVDIIKSGGAKISALEIEEVLRSHPAIEECAVIGVEDPEWGERVCCVVELRGGEVLDIAELRDWAKSRLAPYKVPKEMRCVGRIPRNAMGKVLKPPLASFFVRPAPPEPRDS